MMPLQKPHKLLPRDLKKAATHAAHRGLGCVAMAVLGRWRRMLLAGSLLTALLRPRAYHPRKGGYPAWSRKPPMATKTPARAYSQRGAPHFSEVKTGKNHCVARALPMIPRSDHEFVGWPQLVDLPRFQALARSDHEFVGWPQQRTLWNVDSVTRSDHEFVGWPQPPVWRWNANQPAVTMNLWGGRNGCQPVENRGQARSDHEFVGWPQPGWPNAPCSATRSDHEFVGWPQPVWGRSTDTFTRSDHEFVGWPQQVKGFRCSALARSDHEFVGWPQLSPAAHHLR